MSLRSFLFDWRRFDIKRGDRVLEIGSGANPCIRANVLVDRWAKPKERAGSLVVDRPFVIADAHELPFSDKSFDHSLAIHLLEHLENPAQFLMELQRVSKRGYLETPNPLYEMIFGQRFHRWFVWIKDGVLTLQRRKGVNERVCNLMNYYLVHDSHLDKFIQQNRDAFTTRFKWKDQIQYNICEEDIDLVDMLPPGISFAQSHLTSYKLRAAVKHAIQTILGPFLR